MIILLSIWIGAIIPAVNDTFGKHVDQRTLVVIGAVIVIAGSPL
jgi:hypothetical protein